MNLFTKMRSWLMLMIMGLFLTSGYSFAQENENARANPDPIPDQIAPNKAEDFSLYMWDAFGDGWNGGTLDLVVNGSVVFDDVMCTGSETIMTFSVEDGDFVETVYSTPGNWWNWEGENTYAIYDAWGTLVASDGPSPGPGVSFNVVFPSPKLTVDPVMLDLGEWPIGGWQEMDYFEVFNEGTGVAEWTASELDDPDGVFALMNPALPMDLPAGGTPEMVGVSFVGDGVAEDMYAADYVASWGTGKSVTTADIMVSAYEAPVGDIVENPFMVTLPHVDAGVSSAFPMRSNYNLPGTATNGKDVVYMFSLAEDKEVDVTISNATETPKMAIYTAGFEGEGGPMVGNAVAAAGDVAVDVPLFAGDYYLVVAAEGDDVAMTFDIDISATTMPDPECIVNPMPADGTVEIPSNGITLSWEYGQYVQEYQLLFGTDYPPTDVLMDWTLAGETGDSYALPNLDPSMQYFWQVNVQNNNGTVECDIYGFTTTITPPSDLTATVIENAEDDYDVELNWTSSAKALLGYNVYRSDDDGVTFNMLNTGLVTTNSYTDEDLAYNTDPCYIYQVEAEFDEGVSDMSNQATACITGVGTVDGTVTELLTGDPISGALVKLIGVNFGRTYEFTTGAFGDYDGDVLEDVYDYVVSADGYITETRDGVVVDYNTTVTEDFELDEFPYPVSGDVIATELDDETVQVNWSGSGGGNETEFRYDDGFFTGQLGFNGGTTSAVLGNVHQVDAELTEMSWLLTDNGGPHNNVTIYVMGLDGSGAPDGSNVIFSESVTNTDLEWNTYTFDTPLQITGGFYLAIGYNGFVGLGTDDGIDAPYEFIDNTHFYSVDYANTAFSTFESIGFPVNAMIRAMGVEGGKASYASDPVSAKPARYSSLNLISNDESVYSGSPEWTTQNTSTDKDLMGYNIYRGSCYSEDDFEFLGYTLDDQFTDNTWGSADYGVYRWAVEAVYTNNVSERVYSNCLDKDMEAVVNVEVTTNSGDAPEGCEILFTNTSEPDMMITYELELDATGMATIEPFRKGIYDYTVMLDGFGDITGTAVLVDSDTTFVWQLEELLAPPSDLYVTPTGFATWTGGGAIPFEPYMTSFDEGIPEGWEIIVGGSSADTWVWTESDAGSTLDGTPFMFIDSDGAGSGVFMDEYLVSPVIDASNAGELYVMFDQYFNTGWDPAAFGAIDVYDGSDWVTVLNQTADAGDYGAPDQQMIDVSAYANADFMVRFHYSATWDWWWAVDNVTVTNETGKYSDKGFQFFKIWHDGVFSNDVDTNFYQYGTNPDVDILVPGETYLAEVAALYSTGLSAKSEYEWTYLPCDSFPSWTIFEAYNVDGSDDNVVAWSDNVFFTPIEEDFEGGVLPEGWQMTTNSAIGWFFTTDGSSGFWPVPPGDGTYACANDDAANDDGSVDYLITPEMSLVGLSDLQLTFSSFFDEAWGHTAFVEVSTDGGSTWDVVYDMTNSASSSWTEVQVDLSAYAGEESVWVGFHSDDAGGWTSGWGVDNVSIAPSKAGKANSVVIGTNVYRDGEMIAYVPEPDTFYLDMNLEPGYYDYCVAKVYSEDEGLHSWTSCPDGSCVLDVLVPEDCLAPENLTAEDLLGDGYTATLNWDAPNAFDPVWLQYDDGVNVDGIGLTSGGDMDVAAKWDPDQLADFEGTAISKIKFFAGDYPGVSWTLRVYQGTNGDVIYEQPLTSGEITFGDWNEIMLDTPVEIDITQSIWVGYLVVHVGGEFPAGVANATPNPNSDLVKFGGGAWDNLQNYLPYSWNLAAYVEAAKGEFVKLPVIEEGTIAETHNADGVFQASGNTQNNVDPNYETREFLSYNVYRDGELIAEDVMETTYADEVGVADYFCYEVTAVYSVCGESAPSNEACVDVAIGINNVDNTVVVYPNPAQDYVMVEASSDIRSIEVTNYMGQVVNAVKAVEMTQYRINTSTLSAGVYFVEVETAAGIEKVRIVISE